jgi:hypothetical protein
MGNDSSLDETLKILFGYALAIVLGIVFVHWIIFEVIPDTSYAYPALCAVHKTDGTFEQQKEPVTNNRCQSSGFYAYLSGREGFRVFPATQRVVVWTVEPSSPPQDLKNCKVRDRNNWRCDGPFLNSTMQMVEGSYTDDGVSILTTIYVNKWYWWALRLTNHAVTDGEISH